jgi:hypothetical protein
MTENDGRSGRRAIVAALVWAVVFGGLPGVYGESEAAAQSFRFNLRSSRGSGSSSSDQDVEPTVAARVEPDVVEIGSTLRYVATATAPGSPAIRLVREPGGLEAFDVLGKHTPTRQFNINGRVRRTVEYVYTLKPKREGRFVITPPVVQIGSKRFRTEPKQVEVVGRGEAPERDERSDRRAFLSPQIQPERPPYVGEQITVDFTLYYDMQWFNVKPRPPTEPSLDDFWIEVLDMPRNHRSRVEQIDARMMRAIEMRSYALFPLQAGVATIEPMEVELRVGSLFRRRPDVEIASDPVRLEVRALPPDAPPEFREGNVGEWEFVVTTDTMYTVVGRPVTIRVRAEGQGLPNRLELPELGAIPGARVSEPRSREERETQGRRVVGLSEHTYTVTPTSTGMLKIPSLRFAYFDPDEARYEVIASEPLEISVKAAPDGAKTLPPPAEPLEERATSSERDLVGERLAELREPRWERLGDGYVAGSILERWWFWLLAGLPLLGIVALVAAGPLRALAARRAPKRERRLAADAAIEDVRRAAELGGSDALDAVVAGLRTYATDVLALGRGAVSEAKLADALIEIGVEREPAEALAEILASCNAARYGDSASVDAAALATRCAENLRTIEEARRGGHLDLADATIASAALVTIAPLLVALSVLGGAPTTAVAQTSTTGPGQTEAAADATGLERARAAYEAQRFDEAISSLRVELDERPGDPELLGALGVVAARAERWGTARVALERARLVDPTDEAIAANLEVVAEIVRIESIEAARGRARRIGRSDSLFWWDALRGLAPWYLAIGLVVSLWLVLLALLARRFASGGLRDGLWWLGIAAALTAVGCGALWGARQATLARVTPVVVVAERPSLREGPSEHAAVRRTDYPLVPGVMMEMVEEREAWLKIELPDGSVGWLPREAGRVVTTTASR